MTAQNNLERLYAAHRGDLVTYAGRILGDRTQAEDVVQEAYLRYSSRNPDHAIDEPLAYFYRIVRNLCLDFKRATVRDQEKKHLLSHALGLLEGVRDNSVSPEAEAGARQELLRVSDALAELPDRTRQAFELHRLEGYPCREVAQKLGISVGLAHLLIAQAIDHCRQRAGRKQ